MDSTNCFTPYCGSSLSVASHPRRKKEGKGLGYFLLFNIFERVAQEVGPFLSPGPAMAGSEVILIHHPNAKVPLLILPFPYANQIHDSFFVGAFSVSSLRVPKKTHASPSYLRALLIIRLGDYKGLCCVFKQCLTHI